MICPYCNIGIEPNRRLAGLTLDEDHEDQFAIDYYRCPVCKELILELYEADLTYSSYGELDYADPTSDKEIIYPYEKAYKLDPNYVPEKIIRDYEETYNLLTVSAKASAAMARRLTEIILISELNATGRDLYKKIDSLSANGLYPSSLIKRLQTLRNIGNFAVHSNGSDRVVAEIVEVTQDEANLSIEILQQLIDLVYVQRKIEDERMAAFEAKKDTFNALKKNTKK